MNIVFLGLGNQIAKNDKIKYHQKYNTSLVANIMICKTVYLKFLMVINLIR